MRYCTNFNLTDSGGRLRKLHYRTFQHLETKPSYFSPFFLKQKFDLHAWIFSQWLVVVKNTSKLRSTEKDWLLSLGKQNSWLSLEYLFDQSQLYSVQATQTHIPHDNVLCVCQSTYRIVKNAFLLPSKFQKLQRHFHIFSYCANQPSHTEMYLL